VTFFFQAEDGIRDFHVTGVQTCALPIWNENTDTCAICPWRRRTGCWMKRRRERRDDGAHPRRKEKTPPEFCILVKRGEWPCPEKPVPSSLPCFSSSFARRRPLRPRTAPWRTGLP